MSELTELFGRNAKRDIIEAITLSFFGSDAGSIMGNFEKIGIRNAMKTSSANDRSYYYKGRLWPEQGMRGQFRQVDSIFNAELDFLIDRYNRVEDASIQVDSFLRKLLSICNTVQDVVKLMPPELETHMPNTMLNSLSISKLTITKERESRFRTQYKDAASSAKAYLFYKALFDKE
jgi:hypothetical protein